MANLIANLLSVRYTIKTQIVATCTLSLHVFGGLPVSLNDQTLPGVPGVIRQMPESVKIRLDKGYTGTDKFHSDYGL